MSVPQHIAIIMDGNGRWAQARHLSRSEGHRAGAENVRTIVTECRSLGVRHLTLYTFSRENWKRPETEISTLFSLLVEFIGKEVPRLKAQGIRLTVVGDLDGLPLAARTALRHGMQATQACREMTLNLALNYSGRDEILHAVRQLVADGLTGKNISEAALRARLYTAELPDPDLVIRTSGEVRISNFLLFQCAYSEFYFTDTFWPDFGPEALRAALADYASRSRRFGQTQEQITHGR
ncbi:MAG: polyprenyl diphosphate synthase [Desulfovibrionaceae bacterium]|jgi:undecaprenyl diphosphate synthase|nr:polyprenyl diphosphate synthase [Desulfovibrionaceae bacterium]